MVAYSFQPRFVRPILEGRKAQTIRADRKRHARKGEALQLFTGMRTKHCKLIARAECADVGFIHLRFAENNVIVDPALAHRVDAAMDGALHHLPSGASHLDAFAYLDGFDSWTDLATFWREQHGDLRDFTGQLILWNPLSQEFAHG